MADHSFWDFIPVIGPVISAVSGLFGSAKEVEAQEQTNQANVDLARERMAFEERMSNTAHQREVADLEAAGINKLYTATGGSGASTPAGAQAVLQNPYEGYGQRAINTAKSAADVGYTAALAKTEQKKQRVLDAEGDISEKDAEIAKLRNLAIKKEYPKGLNWIKDLISMIGSARQLSGVNKF